jgi:hypothetical protein
MPADQGDLLQALLDHLEIWLIRYEPPGRLVVFKPTGFDHEENGQCDQAQDNDSIHKHLILSVLFCMRINKYALPGSKTAVCMASKMVNRGQALRSKSRKAVSRPNSWPFPAVSN